MGALSVCFFMIRTTRVVTLFSLLALSVSLSAQGRGRGPLPLNPGDAIPDVSGFAEDGTPFQLKDLVGHPTVIAFGCLT